MEIRIISANDQSIPVAVENEQATYGDVLGFAQVVEFFDAEDADEVRENLIGLNGTDVSGIRNTILNCRVEDGVTLEIDLDAVANAAAQANTAAAGTEGHVTVRSSGGLAQQVVPVIAGQTTVREAVFNNAVRDRFKMNDTQLSAMDIVVNDEKVVNLDAKTLQDGDTIDLSVRAAHDKSNQ